MNYDPTDPDKMRLPTGKTCGDCQHINRCKAIYGHTETDTTCDWSPSRFHAKPVTDLTDQQLVDIAINLRRPPPHDSYPVLLTGHNLNHRRFRSGGDHAHVNAEDLVLYARAVIAADKAKRG